MTRQPVIWVAQQQQLDTLCQKWKQCPLLAVDTEFMRTSTFYPEPALLQINDGQANYLIDPLAIANYSAFIEVMVSPSVQKVLHSCSEDLDVFNTLLKCLPVNLMDTQVAAAFCGYGFSMGYGNLVQAILGVELPKGETRSNWLQRPLTPAQNSYAALDVEHLFEVASILNRQLDQNKRMAWVEEECDLLLQNYWETQNPDNAINRFKSAWRLDSRQLATLIELAKWRDLQAQKRNVPRSYIVKDKSLLNIAEILPDHVGQLRKVVELADKTIRRYGESIIERVAAVSAVAECDLPQRWPRPPSSKQQVVIKQMRESLAELAAKNQLAPEYLARKKDFEYIVRAHADGKLGEDLFPESLQGWRASLVKPEILTLL